MSIDQTKPLSIPKTILNEWDIFGSKELYEKDKYLYCLSVVLSEAFRREQNTYDFNIVQDLLSGEKKEEYTKEELRFFLDDLKIFTKNRAETTTYYTAENELLIDLFADSLPRFAPQKDFDRLKSHWLKKRIHQPILAVLKIRAKEWIKDAPNQIQEDLLDTLS